MRKTENEEIEYAPASAPMLAATHEEYAHVGFLEGGSFPVMVIWKSKSLRCVAS